MLFPLGGNGATLHNMIHFTRSEAISLRQLLCVDRGERGRLKECMRAKLGSAETHEIHVFLGPGLNLIKINTLQCVVL